MLKRQLKNSIAGRGKRKRTKRKNPKVMKDRSLKLICRKRLKPKRLWSKYNNRQKPKLHWFKKTPIHRLQNKIPNQLKHLNKQLIKINRIKTNLVKVKFQFKLPNWKRSKPKSLKIQILTMWKNKFNHLLMLTTPNLKKKITNKAIQIMTHLNNLKMKQLLKKEEKLMIQSSQKLKFLSKKSNRKRSQKQRKIRVKKMKMMKIKIRK